MITGKQRAHLRSMANDLESTFQIGKRGISDNTISQINDHLTAHEIMKINVLKSEEDQPADLARRIGEITEAEVIAVIGRRFVLYRRSDKLAKEGKSIDLPE